MPGPVWDIKISENGSTWVVGSKNHQYICDVRTGRVRQLSDQDTLITLSPNGRSYVAERLPANGKGHIYLRRTSDSRVLKTCPWTTQWGGTLRAFDHEGNTVFGFADRESQPKLIEWNLAKNRVTLHTAWKRSWDSRIGPHDKFPSSFDAIRVDATLGLLVQGTAIRNNGVYQISFYVDPKKDVLTSPVTWSGQAYPLPNGDFLTSGFDGRVETACYRRAGESGLRQLFNPKIDLSCGHDLGLGFSVTTRSYRFAFFGIDRWSQGRKHEYIWIIDARTRKVREIEKGATKSSEMAVTIAPMGNYIAYTSPRDRHLVLIKRLG
jgi:hypothetical protein